jgi:tight adherence protein B
VAQNTHSIVGALVAGGLVGYAPIWWVHAVRRKRMLLFEEHFPQAMALIARAIRAGHAFTTGIKLVSEEVPGPVGSEFRTLYERQNYGLPLDEALREMAARIPIIDARFFATAVLTQRETGGNLAEVLDHLSDVIRERFRVRKQVRVMSAHGRITGYVISGMAPVLAIAMAIVSPDQLRILFVDPLGVRLVAAAVLMQVAGTLVIRKLVDIKY